MSVSNELSPRYGQLLPDLMASRQVQENNLVREDQALFKDQSVISVMQQQQYSTTVPNVLVSVLWKVITSFGKLGHTTTLQLQEKY